MRERTKINLRVFYFVAAMAAASFSVWLTGCSSPQPAAQQEQGPHRYALQGRIVSVEKEKSQAVVDAGEIPGFMAAMKMGYTVKDPNVLNSLSPEDQIKADVVADGKDVWLENIVVVKKAEQPKVPAKN